MIGRNSRSLALTDGTGGRKTEDGVQVTKIQKYKQEKDERRTSNAQHRTSNVGLASLRFVNKIETLKAYPNPTLDVRCSMLDVRFLFRFWSLNIGI